MFPTARQEALLIDLIESSEYVYKWVMDRLLVSHYRFNEDTLLACVNERIKPELLDNRPEGLCPMNMLSWLIREVCHNWLDCKKNKSAMLTSLCKHRGRCYMPASGHVVDTHVWISGVGRIRIEPVEIPTRLYLIEGYKHGGKWFADLRVAVEEPG